MKFSLAFSAMPNSKAYNRVRNVAINLGIVVVLYAGARLLFEYYMPKHRIIEAISHNNNVFEFSFDSLSNHTYYLVISCVGRTNSPPMIDGQIVIFITGAEMEQKQSIVISSEDLFSCNWGPTSYGERDDYAFRIPDIQGKMFFRFRVVGVEQLGRSICGVNLLAVRKL